MRRASASASSRPISARAWPEVSRPSCSSAWTDRRQPQQAQSVGEMAAALADDLCHLLLGVAEPFDQFAVAGRLLDRVEVRALHVLDEGELGSLLVAEIAHDDRHRVQAGLLGRPPAALAGDDLEAAALGVGAGDDRLQQTLLADRLGELGQLDVVEDSCAGCGRSGAQLVDGQQPLLAVRREAAARPAGVSPMSEARPRPNRPLWMGIGMGIPSS